jgi:hypothetical protein
MSAFTMKADYNLEKGQGCFWPTGGFAKIFWNVRYQSEATHEVVRLSYRYIAGPALETKLSYFRAVSLR